MSLIYSTLALWLVGTVTGRPALVVQAPDSPVTIDRAAVVAISDAPPVLFYQATNITPDDLEQFTVIAFVFDGLGTLKARQVAPARRLLAAGETKYSTLVLDGFPIGETDVVVVGVNQAQRTETASWWRAELEAAARIALEGERR
jgi:hypothetical protein